ncbi:hypothetical protein STAQ_33780 [Allostella sp. ATCC 35155]|nr:hypothetical protein STAQ_33780 [Stella sp. ATCC 35155]
MANAQQIVVDIDAVARIARLSVDRANIFLGIALSGFGQRHNLDHRTVERFKFETLNRDLSEGEKEHVFGEWRNWTINCAIRDLIDAFSIYETRIYELDQLISAGGVGIRSKISANSKKFDRHSVSEKWTRLSKSFELPVKYAQHFNSFRALRNCLAHRLGVVGLEDCEGDPPRLRLSWVAPEMVAIAPGLDDVVVSAAGFQEPIEFDTPRQIGVRFANRMREFEPSRSVVLSAADVFEICSTFWSGIDLLRNAVVTNAREKGLFVDRSTRN